MEAPRPGRGCLDAAEHPATLARWADRPASIGGGSPRFEVVDQVLEVIDEVWVVAVRLSAGERDDLSVAFGRLLIVAFCLVQSSKTLVAVMHGGEACQHVVGGLLSLVIFPGVDEGERGIGRDVQLFVAVIA